MRRAAVAAVLAAVLLAVPVVAAAQTPSPAPSGPAVEAAAAILVDLETDGVLFARGVRARRSPASLTKVVTALVARERYALDETVTIGPLAAKIHGSRLGVEEGMTFTVLDLLYALLIDSGNDAANALAEHDPGGYDRFVELMNEKARALGAYDSRFANPHGLDQQGHHTTAWDLAIFGRQLMADPVLAQIVAAPRWTVPWPTGRTRSFTNHNKLIGTYEGALGIKTGFTNQAGRSLMAAAERSGRRFLTVVLAANDQYAETKSLFAYGTTRLATAGSRLAPIPDAPAPETVRDARPGPAIDPRDADPYRWAALLALLAAAMLATLARARMTRPMEEVAWFHPSLEPLVSSLRWDTGPIPPPERSERRRVRERVGLR